jgi:hypothetical protein
MRFSPSSVSGSKEKTANSATAGKEATTVKEQKLQQQEQHEKL